MKRRLLVITLCALLCYAQQAYSSGFFLIEQSVSSMGSAYGGAAAEAADASTVFFNPAGMTKLPCQQAVSGVHFVIPVSDFDDDDSKLSIGLGGDDLTGGEGGDPGELGIVPHTYYVYPMDCGLAFGLGITSPFGLVTDYESKWKGRYHANRSDLLSININPSIAYQIMDCLSIGLGWNWQYIKTHLTNSVDFGSIFKTGLGLTPQEFDGKALVEGDSWGYGGNIGLLYDITPCTRFGVHFRSEVRHHIDGHVKYKLPEGLNPTQEGVIRGVFPNADAKADITFPSFLSFSLYHQWRCFAFLGDISWTKWKVLKRLKIRFRSAQAPSVTTLHWDNTLRYSFGMAYFPNDCWTLRTGFAYDEAPTPRKGLRSVRIPDADRIWWTLGFNYRWNDCISFDFGYAYLWVLDGKVDKTKSADQAGSEDFFRGALKGKWEAHTDIISLQGVWTF